MNAQYEWDSVVGGEPTVSFVVRFKESELQELLAAYEPASGTSPSATVSRPVIPAILNAYIESPGGAA